MKLILGDSLEEMKKMKDASFDAVVTDPPFGIGFNYGKNHKDETCPEDYWKWFSEYVFHIERVVKNGGFISIWQAQLNFPYFWDWFGRDIHIYAGCKNFVQLRKTPINFGYDPIVMYYKKGTPIRPINPKRNIDFFVANTAKFVTEKNSLARKHPCPRPIDQCEQIIQNFVADGGNVLDPFMGSGTIGMACKTHGRNFTGIEISEEYFSLSQQRIEALKPDNQTKEK